MVTGADTVSPPAFYAKLEALATSVEIKRFLFILRPCQHDDSYIDVQSQIKVHTDERTQVDSA